MEIDKEWINQAKVNSDKYDQMYTKSIDQNEEFWAKEGRRVNWIKDYTKIKEVKYSKSNVNIKWFYDGTLNVAYNCIDRHAKVNPERIAIIWEGDDPTNVKKITYKELLDNVSKTANVLKKIGVKKGDRVTIY